MIFWNSPKFKQLNRHSLALAQEITLKGYRIGAVGHTASLASNSTARAQMMWFICLGSMNTQEGRTKSADPLTAHLAYI